MAFGHDIAYVVGALATSPFWSYRLWRTGKWRTDWPGRFGRIPRLDPDGRPTLLIHAVSVGEVNAARTLVDDLCDASNSGWRIVISVTTDTGFARAQELYGATHSVVRYAFDLSWCVHRFLDAIRPDLVALMELEVWPNFVQACHRRNVPVCVVNGRLTERSFKRYRIVAPLIRPAFSRLTASAVQTCDYAQRFITLGTPASRVQVLDTMKWDTAVVSDHVEGAEDLALAMGIDRHRPIVVAGSTGPGEEQLLVETCPPEAQLVLAPRKPERFDAVAELDPTITRRSQHPDGTVRAVAAEIRLFLLDTIGELRKAYCLADVVIVGRSFLGLYGSNVLEPIALGKATIIGPFHDDFADIVSVLRSHRGIEVSDQPGLAAAELLADAPRALRLARAGRDVILSRQGASRRHAELLLQLMPDKPGTRR